ncbi:PAS domain-containing protein [Xanthobacter sp. V0B-10]|uniref:PAS domain-containing protein n=1 Tax=Xanthobacter albus TaxID=3119929 RepID=UPI003726E69C
MMTETKARALDLTEPRLAPLRRDELPSFLVDVSTSAVLAVTSACARLGIAVGHRLPPRVAEEARMLAASRGRAPALVRLRLPRSLTPLLFRGLVLNIADAPAVLFADPAALAEEPLAPPPPEPSVPEPPASAAEPPPSGARFNFETDADDRLRALSPVLAAALGAQASAWIGASFPELEEAGHVASARAITQALARGTSFTGVPVIVPGAPGLELELGGVPLLDAGRHRVATRGFGIMRRWAPGADAQAEPAPAPGGTVAAFPSNVVPFNGLTPRESRYFDEIARTLEAAMRTDGPRAPEPSLSAPLPPAPAAPRTGENDALRALDALPLATLLEDDARLVHANRTFFQWTGWPDLDAVRAAGGVPGVLQSNPDGFSDLLTAAGTRLPMDASEAPADFYGPDARLRILQARAAVQAPAATAPAPEDPRRAALDLVPWPVLILDGTHQILFANAAACARLDFSAEELEDQPVTTIIAPEARGEAVGWLDAAARGEGAQPRALHLRPFDGTPFHALAGLAPVGEGSDQYCLVIGPEPSVTEPVEAPAADLMTSEAVAIAPPALEAATEAAMPEEMPAAAPEPATPPATLHLVARRLVESLGPSFAAVSGYAPDEADALPGPVRDALNRVRRCLDDLGALAEPLAEPEREPAEIAPLVRAALDYALPMARRRQVTVRTDIEDVPAVLTQPARLARLMRLMVEDALDGAPSGTAITVSLACGEAEDTPVVLLVGDAGAPVDEADDAAARDPLALSRGVDRFSRAGRPLRRARLAAEAEAIGAGFEVRRGLARGMTSQLSLPRQAS